MTDPLAQQLPLTDLPICVAGEWRRGRGHAYASIYPADGSVSAELRAASAADAAEAVERADAAFRRTDWASRKPHERARVLYRVAEGIRARREELAHRPRGCGRHRMDQHLQAILDRHAVWRLARQLHRPREGPLGYSRIHGAKKSLLGHECCTIALGRLKLRMHRVNISNPISTSRSTLA